MRNAEKDLSGTGSDKTTLHLPDIVRRGGTSAACFLSAPAASCWGTYWETSRALCCWCVLKYEKEDKIVGNEMEGLPI